jgi:hypothetical protein
VSPAQFICECSRFRCVDRVTLTLGEYAEVRAEDMHFVIVPGHLDPDIERIVRRTEEYAVVEKFGFAGAIAEADA